MIRDIRGRIAGRCVGASAAVAVAAMTAAVDGRPVSAMELFAANTETTSIHAYPPFRDMVDRYVQQYREVAEVCAGDALPACEPIARWSALFQSVDALDPRGQLEAVNGFFNQFPHVSDQENWGEHDYWATPLQFLESSGDCEDYAVAKYYTLRGLGFDVTALRVVIVMDEMLGIQHAVLAVDMGHEVLILDNLIETVVAAGEIAHYTPLVSVSELGIWRHRAYLASQR